VDMSITFVANLQASKRVKPGDRALNWPTRFTQSAAMGRADFRGGTQLHARGSEAWDVAILA
jgi:hypothetical protein